MTTRFVEELQGILRCAWETMRLSVASQGILRCAQDDSATCRGMARNPSPSASLGVRMPTRLIENKRPTLRWALVCSVSILRSSGAGETPAPTLPVTRRRVLPFRLRLRCGAVRARARPPRTRRPPAAGQLGQPPRVWERASRCGSTPYRCRPGSSGRR